MLFERDEDAARWEAAAEAANDDSDTELLANIERARGDHLLAARDLEGALAHYGRAVFYGAALQVTSNLAIGPNAYTKAFYRGDIACTPRSRSRRRCPRSRPRRQMAA